MKIAGLQSCGTPTAETPESESHLIELKVYIITTVFAFVSQGTTGTTTKPGKAEMSPECTETLQVEVEG